ncbi:MAG: hypothetical protein KZQ83_19810 [gamma proteobacterium symbiont of Taylorina sp.]|nr:hypothetical protein [gamma proteobacterium symbiont of Taylorina sp.]
MHKSKNIFIILSLVIAFIISIFSIRNYYYSKNNFYTNLDIKHQNYFATYNTILESTYNGLSMQARIFSNDKEIQDLFLHGKKLLEKEGGNSGGEKTAEIRKKLYQQVINSWQDSTKNIDGGLFQFHLGPGSLSFLRVHKPKKFGDKMDTLRFIVVDTNKEHTPRTGFETGRIVSAIRSVVPVFSWDQQMKKKVYTGALEIGVSYKQLFQTINNYNQIEIGILLNNEHVKQTVWDEFITVFYKQKTVINCNCILESSSSPTQKTLLEYIFKNSDSNQTIQDNSETKVIAFGAKIYSYKFYPLRDYLGEKEASRQDVGSIFIAKDISNEMLSYRRSQLYSFIYAVIAYCLIELLLIITFFNITRQLSSQIKHQAQQLLKQTRIIDLDRVKYKNLINTINSNYFFYTRDKEHFSFVSPSVKQVLGYNDTEFLSNALHYLSSKSHAILFQTKNKQTFLDQKKNTFEIDIINKNGRLQYLLITETIKNNLNKYQMDEVEGFAQDISQSRQEKMLLQLRCNILQMISDKTDQKKILETLVLDIEHIIQDINCAIMLFDKESMCLLSGAAPSVNKELISALDGKKVESATGSCGIAAVSCKRIIISDMKKYKGFKNLEHIIENTDYQSCWSEPVLSSKAKVLATIDVYYNKKQKPDESDFAVIAVGIKLISTLLEPST